MGIAKNASQKAALPGGNGFRCTNKCKNDNCCCLLLLLLPLLLLPLKMMLQIGAAGCAKHLK